MAPFPYKVGLPCPRAMALFSYKLGPPPQMGLFPNNVGLPKSRVFLMGPSPHKVRLFPYKEGLPHPLQL